MSRKFKQQRERKEVSKTALIIILCTIFISLNIILSYFIKMEKVVSLSHRERVEAFSEKLGNLTELNDIPRVSAAGNG